MAVENDVVLNMETGEEELAKPVVPGEAPEESQNEEEHPESNASGDDETAGNHDEELAGAPDDAEREEIRARRREERRHRKEAQREREDTLRRELAARDTIINEMRSRLDAVERRNTGSEQAQLENAKKAVAGEYAYYKDQIRIATEAGNGTAVAEATERLIQSQRKFDQLTSYEQAYRQKTATPQPLDPRMVNNAQEWMNRNKWYDPAGKDSDSRITLTVDQQMAEEGWDPTTKEYWQELETRVKKYLPHRVNRGKISSDRPRSVVTGSGREGVSASNAGSYKLSAERVSALKDAGIWDDPKQRAEAVKRFREFDQQNKA